MDGVRPTFEGAFRAEYPAIVRVLAPIVGSVADALGCREATVRVHLHRARQALAASDERSVEEVGDAT